VNALFKPPSYHSWKAYGSDVEILSPCIHNLSIRLEMSGGLRRAGSFDTSERNLDRMLSVPQNRSGRGGKDKKSFLRQHSNRENAIVYPVI
jgi:hypothetical protein